MTRSRTRRAAPAAAFFLAAALLAGCANTTAFAPSTGGPVLASAPAIASTEPRAFDVILGVSPSGIVPVGAEVALELTSARSGFASVYALSPDGRVTVVAENRRLTAGNALRLPGDAQWRLRARAPAGREHLLAVVALDPIPGVTVANPPAALDTVGHQAFLDALDRRLATLPRDRWAVGYTSIDITQP